MGRRVAGTIDPILPKSARNPSGTLQDQLDRVFALLRQPISLPDDFQLLDENGKPIAWFGSKQIGSGYYRGAWLGQCAVGGQRDTPASWPFVVDATGKLTITIGGATDAAALIVKDSSGTEIARIGRLDAGPPAVSGLWAQNVWLGSASYSTANVRISGSEAVLEGLDFTLVRNGTTTTLSNDVDGLYTVAFQAVAGSYKTQFFATGGRGMNGANHLWVLGDRQIIAGDPGGANYVYLDAFSNPANIKISGNQVVGPRLAAVGDATQCSVANAGDTYTTGVRDLINDLKAKLNGAVTKVNTINDRLGTPGHGLTSD